MSILYLAKKNDELISFCSCTESLVGDPGQLDCPWCGCGWLFSCTKCRKAFSFAVATEIDKTWEEIAAEDLYGYSKKQPTHEEISEWVEAMKAMQSEIELGKTYVYLDGILYRLKKKISQWKVGTLSINLSMFLKLLLLKTQKLKVSFYQTQNTGVKTKFNKSLKQRTFGAGQFLSRAFVVLLRKSIPQNHNLKTAA